MDWQPIETAPKVLEAMAAPLCDSVHFGEGSDADAKAIIRAALTAARAQGYVLVPVVADPVMVMHAAEWYDSPLQAERIWAAMVAAAGRE